PNTQKIRSGAVSPISRHPSRKTFVRSSISELDEEDSMCWRDYRKVMKRLEEQQQQEELRGNTVGFKHGTSNEKDDSRSSGLSQFKFELALSNAPTNNHDARFSWADNQRKTHIDVSSTP